LGKKMSAEQVILVVDRLYGARVGELSAAAAVWLVDSIANHPFLSALKKKFTPEASGSLTWFADDPTISSAELAARKIATLEDHHGEYSQNPAYSRLRVIGASLEPVLLSAIEDCGFRLVSVDGAVTDFQR
jgi:hypothetical protein